jgi:hypothetical protein
MGVCFNKNKERIYKTPTKEKDKETLGSERKSNKKEEISKSSNKIENLKNESYNQKIVISEKQNSINTSNNEHNKVFHSGIETKRVSESQISKEPKHIDTGNFAKEIDKDKESKMKNENYKTNNHLCDTLEKLINNNSDESRNFEETEDNTLKFNSIQNEPLFNLV